MASPARSRRGPASPTTEISLGLLTDLSGVFAPLAKPIVQATQEYWKEQNAKGGVCDRKIKLVVKDHGYDPQKAVVQYRELSDVAALQQLLGSPITAALLPTLKSDSMLSLLAAWPSSLLGNDFIIEIGATYDIEMINGLGYLMEQGKLKEGDKIGHVYFEGEYGENGLKGSEAFAKENGMAGRPAEDQGDRRGHVRPGQRAQAGRREGHRHDDRPDPAGVRGRHRRHPGPQRADRRQQPDVRPGPAREPGGRGGQGQRVHRGVR